MTTPLDQQTVAYFGATTASVSHELRNAATIINEAAGLLSDLTLAAERGRPLDPVRLRKIARDITAQVQRSVELLGRLHRFAHCADESVQSVELGGLVRDVVALSGRAASGRGMELAAELPAAAVSVTGDAFGLHRLLGLSIRLCVLGNAEPTTITVRVAPVPGEAVLVHLAPSPPCEAAAWQAARADLGRLATSLGVAVSLAPEAATLQLQIPRRPTGAHAGEGAAVA